MKKKNGGGRNAAVPTMVMSRVHPPPHKSNIVVHHKYRFLSSIGAMLDPVTILDVLACAGCYVLNTVQVTPVFTAFRVKQLRMWGGPVTISQATGLALVSKCAVEWSGNTTAANAIFATNLEFDDTSSSSAYPAYLGMAPPAGSMAAQWIQPNVPSTSVANSTLFSLSFSAGTIVELDLELVLMDGSNIGPITVATTSVPVNNIGYTRLDRLGAVNALDVTALTQI